MGESNMVQKTTSYIPLKELTKISFSCDHCHATIVVDIGEREQRQTILASAHNKICPVCSYRIKNTIFLAFQEYLNWFDKAMEAEQNVQFVIDKD
jgi:hypothetical protein